MKNLFGKMLVGIAGCAMALSISAFAADPAVTNLTVTPALDAEGVKTGVVTVSGTITGDAEAKEATIIVAPEDITTLALIDDENIKYIDQETAAEGAFEFTFKLATGVKYNVWCGGTDVTVEGIGNGVADLTISEETGYKIVGTIVLPAGSYADVTAVATAGDVDTAGTVDTADETAGAYEIEVAPGTYSVVVGKPGYMYKTYSDVVVAEANKDLGTVTLIPGALTEGDNDVNLSDLTLFLSYYKKTEFDTKFDLNDDGSVNLTDLTLLLSGYKKSYED